MTHIAQRSAQDGGLFVDIGTALAEGHGVTEAKLRLLPAGSEVKTMEATRGG